MSHSYKTARSRRGRKRKMKHSPPANVKKRRIVEQPLYCICRKPENGEPMVKCGKCSEWLHYSCVGLNPSKNHSPIYDDQFECPCCNGIGKTHKKNKKRKSNKSEETNVEIDTNICDSQGSESLILHDSMDSDDNCVDRRTLIDLIKREFADFAPMNASDDSEDDMSSKFEEMETQIVTMTEKIATLKEYITQLQRDNQRKTEQNEEIRNRLLDEHLERNATKLDLMNQYEETIKEKQEIIDTQCDKIKELQHTIQEALTQQKEAQTYGITTNVSNTHLTPERPVQASEATVSAIHQEQEEDTQNSENTFNSSEIIVDKETGITPQSIEECDRLNTTVTSDGGMNVSKLSHRRDSPTDWWQCEVCGFENENGNDICHACSNTQLEM